MSGSDQDGVIDFPPSNKPELMNPVVLAFIGDAIHHAYVREYLISQSNHRLHHLHRQETHYVSANAQALALRRLQPLLDEEEADVVRRGRNAKSGAPPKNTDVVQYRLSTAFECLIGYLYYKQRMGRMRELMRESLRR